MAALALCWCAQASHCDHFFCWRAQAVGTWASVVVAHGLSCSIECGIVPTALTGKFLTTRPPGKPLYLFYRSVFNQGRFCPQETCGKVWRCFCLSRCRERGGCYWHLMDRGQGFCWTLYKVGFQQRNYPSKIVSGAEVKKPCYRWRNWGLRELRTQGHMATVAGRRWPPRSMDEEEMTTHSSILAWGIPWTEKPDRLQSTGPQRLRHRWAQAQ